MEWVQQELDTVSIVTNLTLTFYQFHGVKGSLSSTQPFKSQTGLYLHLL